MEDNLIEIFAANEMYKIDIIRELLSEADIESFILDQKGRSFLIGDIHLFVNKEDEEKAKSIISKHDM
ncbi:MAG: DUF2007 domain-containing protein [Bacteroidales bacterium]|nr:DUF2007 domain-containing protein [Bacteroidales bacterium]